MLLNTHIGIRGEKDIWVCNNHFSWPLFIILQSNPSNESVSRWLCHFYSSMTAMPSHYDFNFRVGKASSTATITEWRKLLFCFFCNAQTGLAFPESEIHFHNYSNATINIFSVFTMWLVKKKKKPSKSQSITLVEGEFFLPFTTFDSIYGLLCLFEY